MYEESNVEYNKGENNYSMHVLLTDSNNYHFWTGNATRCTLEDNDSSDDNKPISGITYII